MLSPRKSRKHTISTFLNQNDNLKMLEMCTVLEDSEKLNIG